MNLLEKHFDLAFAAPDGIQKLRELILTLAMQGKLVPQDPDDQPASELLRAIEAEKQRLVKAGKIKQPKPLLEIKLEEVPYDLPKGWEWCYLDNICTLITDGTHHTPTYVETGVPFISVKDVSSGVIDFSTTRFISEQEHEELIKRCHPEKGDVLLTKVGTTGIAVPINTDTQFSIFVSVALLKLVQEFVDTNYVTQLINSPLVRKYSVEGTEGVGNKNLVLRKIKAFLIPLPPLTEQHRIVAKIDRLMARCDELEKLRTERNQKRITIHIAALNRLLTAKEANDFSTAWRFIAQHFGELYSVKENVAELRKAILQLAVMGKLVPQDPADEPALILVNTIRSKRSESEEKSKKYSTSKSSNLPINIPFQIPSSWIWQRVTDIYEVAGGIQKTPQRTPVLNFFPYLRVANVQRGRLDLSQIEYFELFDGELDKRKLKPGDLLIVEGNGSDKEIGRCAIWNGEIENCVHQNHIIRMRPTGHDGQLFTLLFLNSSCGMAEMKNLAITTSGLYSLSVGKIREILIPLPPLAEQHRIVAKVDQLMALCDRLEQQIDAATSKQTTLLNAVMAQV